MSPILLCTSIMLFCVVNPVILSINNDSKNTLIVLKNSSKEVTMLKDSKNQNAVFKNSSNEDAMLKDSSNDDVMLKYSRNVDALLKDSIAERWTLKDSKNDDELSNISKTNGTNNEFVVLKNSSNEVANLKYLSNEVWMLNDSKKEDVLLNDSKIEDVLLNDSKIEDVLLNDSKEEEVLLNDSKKEDVLLNDSKIEDGLLNDSKKEDVLLNDFKYESGRGQTWDELMNVLKSETKLRLGTFNLTNITSTLDIRQECRASLQQFEISLADWEKWAVMMADSSGGLPSGILDGRMTSFGSFDQCLQIRGSAHFQGQYCMLGLKTPLLAEFYDGEGYSHRNDKYRDTYGKPPEWVEDFIERSGPLLQYQPFFLGTCLPSTCSSEDVKAIYAQVSEPFGFRVSSIDCQVEEQIHWATADIVAVCFFSLIAVLSSLGTAVDIVGRYLYGDQEDEKWQKHPLVPALNIVRFFSVPANMAKLVEKHPGSFACLDGLRVLSFMLIIINHTVGYYTPFEPAIYRNFLDKTLFEAFFLDASHAAVDTFFCISGFLVVYTTWKKLDKNDGRFNILKFMLQKYMRLTPSLALSIGLLIVMYKLGSGPMWNVLLGPRYESCQRFWWRNFLYINNWGNTEEKRCNSETWFLAALMQCHLIGIILLCMVYRWPIPGTVFGSVLVLGTLAYPVRTLLEEDYPMPRIFHPQGCLDPRFISDFFFNLHHPTYCHLSSYIIGMIIGYIFLKHRKKQLHSSCKAFLWIVTACLLFYSSYGSYFLPDNRTTRMFFYLSFRTSWALGLGWIFYSCGSGQGGVVNGFLSWRGFSVLGKISYMLYLLHFIIIQGVQFSIREASTRGDGSLVLEILGITTVTVITSVIAYVTVELPFGKITTTIFK